MTNNVIKAADIKLDAGLYCVIASFIVFALYPLLIGISHFVPVFLKTYNLLINIGKN